MLSGRSSLNPLLRVCLLLILVTGCATVKQEERHALGEPVPGNLSGLEIYLLIGQSNMAGRAQILAPDFDTLQDVYLFRGDSLQAWEPAVNPLNKYSTIRRELSVQQLGPGYYFGLTLMHALPGRKVGLVVNARGGTSIDRWMPDSSYFKEAVRRTREAGKYGTLKAILWHQGESDVKKYREYPQKIVHLIGALRSAFGNPELPFVAGELAEEKPNRAEFNRMLEATLAGVPNTAVVPSEGLTTYDSTHFDTPSMRLLGERYGVEVLKLRDNHVK